jgi:hypothetical protein
VRNEQKPISTMERTTKSHQTPTRLVEEKEDELNRSSSGGRRNEGAAAATK